MTVRSFVLIAAAVLLAAGAVGVAVSYPGGREDQPCIDAAAQATMAGRSGPETYRGCVALARGIIAQTR
jgi:hypothetical protein